MSSSIEVEIELVYIASDPVNVMLHDILNDDHIQRHPPLIGHYTNF